MANEDPTQFPEHRRAERILAPFGTTATFITGSGSIDTLWVKDISVAGMLLCGHKSTSEYPVKSLIYNIHVDVPTSELTACKKICFIVDSGTIVRSFMDQASGNYCYGVDLIYKSTYVKEQIELLVRNG